MFVFSSGQLFTEILIKGWIDEGKNLGIVIVFLWEIKYNTK